MRILQIAPNYPPYLGGQERFIFNLSLHLVRLGHLVTVLTSRYLSTLPSYSEEEGIRVFRYRELMRPLRNPISPGLLFHPRAVRDVDVIHAHNEHSFAANAAFYLGWRFKKPVVLSVHGRLVMGSRLGDLAVRIYESTASHAVFCAAAEITVATPSEKKRLIRDYRIPDNRIALIPVGIDIHHWDMIRRTPHRKYPWESDIQNKKVILIATQLFRRKGIDYLIRAMPRILLEDPEVILLIAGTGDEEANLRNLVRSLGLERRIRFLGRLFDKELSTAYQAANVFVLPSLSEGLPTCVMEAWAHEKPVVATNVDGMQDCFSEVADLVPPADSEAMAAGVINLLKNPRRADERGKSGRRLMEEKFTWPYVTAQMVSAYESAIARTVGSFR